MDAIDQFATEAVRFEEWAHTEERNPGRAACEALIRISSLYVAALQLPPPFTDELEGHPDVQRLPTDESAKVKSYLGLPIDMYGEVFDPLSVPPEEPVIGSIADDVIDIYRDVVTGLRAYQAGNKSGALWEWGFGFRHHWGEHATGAIRAIHAWLASNEFDYLSKVP
jgi:hypothetical protein